MSTPPNLFDPAHYAGVRKPALDAQTLPPWCYTSPQFYEREQERIFRRTWNFVGRKELVPNPGDYYTLELAGVPLVLMRGEDGEVRAFSNTCPHRGTRLLDGRGTCVRRVTCPYHSWAFSFDGALAAAAGMEQTRGFDKASYGLIPIRLESYGGFLFANFGSGSESLPDYLGDFPEQLGSYGFEELACTRIKHYEVECNWKIYVENQREGYHVPTVHRGTLGSQPAVQLETRGNWSGAFFRKKGSEGVLKGEKAPFPPITSLEGRAAEGTHFTLVYPHTFIGLTMDAVWWMECRPKGPSHVTVVVGSCFPKSTIARPDFEEGAARYYERWDKSHPEDNVIAERVQKGLESPFARPGRYAALEQGVHTISNWIVDRVIGPTA